MKSLFETLKERQYIYQCTNEDEVRKLCDEKKTTVYVGIDPTANSLHIGHCVSLMMLRKFQDAGHRVIVLLGGATAQIGDPTGKSDMRAMVTTEFINSNYEKIKQSISKFVKLDGENPAIIVNNADWMKGYDYINFMRDVGTHFNVAEMLTSDACKTRMATGGLTFFEMGYQLLQAYDFLKLNQEYDCELEIGGSDQWANIVAGVNLVRKKAFLEGKEKLVNGLTCPLLLTKEGKKMGKTAKGALWIDKEKTTPYDFYQYFYNVDDKDVEMLLVRLTELSLDEIKEIMSGDIRDAKKRMAYEITKRIHGKDDADEAMNKATSLFKTEDFSNADEVKLSSEDLKLSIIDIIMKANLASSKSDARRMMQQNAYMLNDERLTDFNYVLKDSDFNNGFAVLKKGKKSFVKLVKEN